MSLVVDDLVTSVGSLLDVTVGANSTPSTDEIKKWLYEGAVKMMSVLPEDQLGGYMQKDSVSDVADLLSLYTQNISPLRIVTVVKGGVPCTKVPHTQLLRAAIYVPNLFVDKALYAETGVSQELNLHFYPADVADVDLYYVAYPGDDADSWNSITMPPTAWGEHLIGYATMMGRIQDEEPEQAQMLYQMWMQGVQSMGSNSVQTSRG